MHCTFFGDLFAGRGAVEFVHGGFGGRDGRAVGFRVGVAESGRVADGGRGPEVAGRVFVERGERRVGVDVLAGFEDCGAVLDLVLRGHPVVGVDGLPDGEEPVDVGMMEPENGVEG